MTACTDEERRFVAAALRAYDGRGADADTIGEVTAIIIGAGDADGWSWREIYARLADLIDPACDKGEKDIQPDVTCDREALMPCPFCGSEAEMVTNRSGDNFVRCTNRQCAARTRFYHENEAGARMSWNRRGGRTGGEAVA